MRTSKEYPLSGTQFPHLVAGTSVLKDRKRHPLMVYLLWIAVVMLTLESYCVSVLAQRPIPEQPSYIIETSGALSTTTKTQFFILGGMVPIPSIDEKWPNMVSVNQLFALDLTTAWNASSPVWGPAKYPAEYPETIEGIDIFWYTGILAFSLDEKYLSAFGNQIRRIPFIGTRLSLATRTWSAGPPASKTPLEFVNNTVQDRETGLVYMVTTLYGNHPEMKQMYRFDINNNSLVSTEPLQGVFENSEISSSVYSAFGKSLLYFCIDKTDSFHLVQHYPDIQNWKTVDIVGSSPSSRVAHCMASNEDGTKVVLFGGLVRNATRFDGLDFAMDLWILDVPTMTWTQGPSAPQPRVQSACGIINDTFINWGGYTGTFTEPASILLFDLKTNTFVDEYKPSGWDTPSPTPIANSIATGTDVDATSTTSASGDASTTGVRSSRSKTLGSDNLEIDLGKDAPPEPPHNQAAIIGGAGGVMLLVAAAGAGFFFYRRKQQYRRAPFSPSTEWSSTDGHGPDGGVASRQKPDLAEGSDLPPLSPYRRGALDPEATPMRAEFLEQERQGLIRLQHQQQRDSTLLSPSLDSPGLAGDSFGSDGRPAADFHPSPYQPPSLYQGQQEFSPQHEGQRWSSPLSTITSPQHQPREEHRRKSIQQINRQSLQLQQQYQSGLVNPPAPNYQTRPMGP